MKGIFFSEIEFLSFRIENKDYGAMRESIKRYVENTQNFTTTP
ncbi:hypothetical protein BN938_2925 [Mucinivorans hirudinis]|uniref:Uncharacterized protein n=1 Tax=Mucinivorans hirudinis TaxID=1433126 RepID=A0A060RBJ6_9BACT|nr:hypothetical protein BN938_2925 [Mucinivorans hirudinis]